MARMFGTDGVRGVANRELTPEIVLQLGRAGAYVLTGETQSHAPRILLGKDTRLSGDMLESALTAGLCSVGASVYLTGVIPSPGLAYLVRAYGMDAGVMISASHNPMQDNGIKFFNADGYKLSDALEDKIEESFLNRENTLPRPEGSSVGAVHDCPDAARDYIHFLLSTVPDLRLDGCKVALDCANGATYQTAPAVFEALGADVRILHHKPDGININADCGSTHLRSLRDFVTENKMDIGLAFDGDGDRVLCVDETGAAVEGDEILAVCGLDMKKRGILRGNAVVTTVMSNMGLSLMCRDNGITLYKTAVGDRYVLEKMLEGDYVLGGEQSGHIIFKAHNTTGDGILTGLQLLSVMRSTGEALSRLKKVIQIMPQALVNARVKPENKNTYLQNERVSRLIGETEARLAGEGRVLVRPSGTEPLVRVMIEGRDITAVDAWTHELAQVIEQELG